MEADERSDKELLTMMQQLTEEILILQETLQYRHFDVLHAQLVRQKGASDLEADLAVQNTFGRILERILKYDPQHAGTPIGLLRTICNRELANIRAGYRGLTSQPLDEVVETFTGETMDSTEDSVKRGNRDWTPFQGFLYFQNTILTVESLEDKDRSELRNGPIRHPGHQRPELREARARYRAIYKSHAGKIEPVLLEEE
jgi:hypothetical protein